MLKKMRWFPAILVTLWSSAPTAEPSSTERYLMSTDASLFSFGMMRLNARLDSLGDKTGRLHFAGYDWDRNRINIGISRFAGEEPTKENCREAIVSVRRDAGVGPDGKTMFNDHSLYASFFSQIGYKNNNEPNGYEKQIDKIIRIRADLVVLGESREIKCEGELLSNEVLFVQEEKK